MKPHDSNPPALKAISACHLYGILDLGYVAPDRACAVVSKMIEGGIDVIQLRAKKAAEVEIEPLAEEIHALTRGAGIPFIMNDHPILAGSADGVHVGQDDLPVSAARGVAQGFMLASPTLEIRPLKPGETSLVKPIIGKSTHSVAQAVAAEQEGADYIGFGPVFATPTKPEYPPIGIADIKRIHTMVNIPIFCIGGIKLNNLTSLIDAGATRVVIVSGILQAADIAKYVADAKSLLRERLKF